MTRHYFHIRDGARVELDPTGLECADIAAAKRHAVSLAAARAPSDDGSTDDWRIEIADAAGQYLASVDGSGGVSD